MPKLSLGSLPVPVVSPTQVCKSPMSTAVLFIEFQSLADGLFGRRIGIRWGQPPKLSKVAIAACEPYVSCCKARILLDGILVITLGFLDFLTSARVKRHCPQISLKSLRIYLPAWLQTGLLVWS